MLKWTHRPAGMSGGHSRNLTHETKMKTQYHIYPDTHEDSPSYAVATPMGLPIVATVLTIHRTEAQAAKIAAVFTIASKAEAENSELHQEILEMQARIIEGAPV